MPIIQKLKLMKNDVKHQQAYQELLSQHERNKHIALSMNFKTTTRDQRKEIFRNKTNAPAVGQYNPESKKFKTSIYKPHINGEHLTELDATQRKLRLSKTNLSICQHVPRTISTGGMTRYKFGWPNQSDIEASKMQRRMNNEQLNEALNSTKDSQGNNSLM